MTIEQVKTKSLELISLTGKRVGVFEQTLSGDGVYFLLIQPKKTFLCKTRYNSTSMLNEFSSLDSALEFVQQNHYYE